MYMRQFYLAFPIGHTLCDELSWSTDLVAKKDSAEIPRIKK